MTPSRTGAWMAVAAIALPLGLLLNSVGTVDADRVPSWLRLEVSYGLGRGPDGLAPALAYELSRSLPAHVAPVEYRGEPTGLLVAPPERMRFAPSDALLIASTDAVTIAPLRNPEDAAPVARGGWCPLLLIGATPHVLIVRSDSQIDSVADLIMHARRNPGELSYATLGSGSSTDAIAAHFVRASGVDMLAVPYRHGAIALKDLLAGDVTAVFATLQSVLPALLAGQVRAVAVTGDSRATRLPGVPTFAELGMHELTPGAWYGLFAPCDISAERQRAIGAASFAALPHGTDGLDTPDRMLGGADFAAFLRDEQARWRPLIDAGQQ